MTTRSLYRFSAVMGILSGLCIILGMLLIPLPDRQIGEIFDFFSPFFALLFVVGIYLRQRKEAGNFGGVASIILFFGLAAVVCLDFIGAFILPYFPEGTADQLLEGPTGAVYAMSGITFLIGEIFFGISVLRAKVFSRVAAFLFILGMFTVPLGVVFPETVVNIGSIIAGIGLIWWGIELYRLADIEG